MLTSEEQHRLNKCYILMKSALNEIAQIQHKDAALNSLQHKMYSMEDTLYQYVGFSTKGEL